MSRLNGQKSHHFYKGQITLVQKDGKGNTLVDVRYYEHNNKRTVWGDDFSDSWDKNLKLTHIKRFIPRDPTAGAGDVPVVDADTDDDDGTVGGIVASIYSTC